MSRPPKILAFSGSLRKDSYNQRLVQAAAKMAQSAGAEVEVVHLQEFALPLFDEDLERDQGTPSGATRLKSLLIGADGLLIASPEYNSSVTAALKNAIDWASRPKDGEAPLAAFRGKVCALLSASPGGLGGLRGLVHLRAILGNIGVIVLPDQAAIGAAHEAFNADGGLVRERDAGLVQSVVLPLVKTTKSLIASA